MTSKTPNQPAGLAARVGPRPVVISFEVRGRYAFYWPLVGSAAMFASYYLVLFIASRVAA